MLFRGVVRICLGLSEVLIKNPLQPHSLWAEEKSHWHPLPFQVWLFHQKPESLNPLVKYLSATTGFGSNYVTSKKVTLFPLFHWRGWWWAGPWVPDHPTSCPASLLRVSPLCHHTGLFSFPSALSCLLAWHTFSPPKLLLPIFFLIHYYYLFLRSQLLCDLLHWVRCFHARFFWPVPVLGRTHSAVGSLLQGALWRGDYTLFPCRLPCTWHMLKKCDPSWMKYKASFLVKLASLCVPLMTIISFNSLVFKEAGYRVWKHGCCVL